jgi:hypothetical protein
MYSTVPITVPCSLRCRNTYGTVDLTAPCCLLHAVCDVRDGLRRVYQDHPGTKEIYIEVEKVSKIAVGGVNAQMSLQFSMETSH